MEYVKDCCATRTGKQCRFCEINSWKGKKFVGIPVPYPDYTKHPLFKYKDVSETTLYKDEANKIVRAVDDFLPRAQLKKEFSTGNNSTEDPDSIKIFSNTYIVEEDHVRSYLNHLLCLQRAKEIRTNQRKRDIKLRSRTNFTKITTEKSWHHLVTL